MNRFELRQNKDLKAYKEGEAAPKDVHIIGQRTRFGIGASFLKRVKMFIQFQDVRLWGEEANTLGDFSANNFDLHQGWTQIELVPSLLSVKVGRMELKYDNQRIIGPVGWTFQGRSFDSVLLKLKKGIFQGHMFYATLAEKGSLEDDSHLFGLWGNLKASPYLHASLLYVLDRTPLAVERFRHTVGMFLKGKAGRLSYTGEFYYQAGSMKVAKQELSINAFMTAFSAAYSIPAPLKPKVVLRGEFLSGDDDPLDKEHKAFDTLFATNHKFYGYMDFFLNIPVHTKQRGLMDIGGRVQIFPAKGMTIWLDHHMYRLFVAPDSGEAFLGNELNLVVKKSFFHKHFSIAAGYGIFVPMAGAKELAKGDKAEHWFFLQTNAQF